MAEPIVLKLVPRDPREALYHRLEKAPLEHVEALLAAYEVLQGLHDRGVLETLRGVRCIGIQTADEWQLYLSGRARVTIFGAHGRTRVKTAICEVAPPTTAPRRYEHQPERCSFAPSTRVPPG